MRMKLIIGLGNPGEQYKHTRHNLGFRVVEALAKQQKLSKWRFVEKLKSEIAADTELVLAKPQTYMNNSGMAVACLVRQYASTVDLANDIWVVHDELDLPLGTMRIRRGGGAAGHHGVESIIQAVPNTDFIRVRLGIGEERKLAKTEEFVLAPFAGDEKQKASHIVELAVEAILVGISEGVEAAMNRYNK